MLRYYFFSESEQINLPANSACFAIIGNIVGGMLICCIVSHIYCHVRRKIISNATVETSPEGQYEEIGTISYNMVINDPIHNLELDNSDNASNEDERNGVLSSNGDESSNDSSVIGRPGDGYEN